MASRLVRLLRCLSPRITDTDQPEILGIDIHVLRSLCGEGLPDDVPALRAATWKLVLGYLPSDIFQWDTVLAASRTAYAGFVRDLASQQLAAVTRNGELARGDCDDSESEGPSFGDRALDDVYEQINKDIYRTRAELDFFARHLDGRQEIAEGRPRSPANVSSPQRHYDALARVLLLFGKFNPGIRYVQGMNEICAPLYYVFAQDPLNSDQAEADTFFCFTLLMGDMRDAFQKTLDHTENGMIGRIDQFSELLQEKDSVVWKHLDKLEVSPMFYSVRWITLMLTQDLEMPDVLRVWDSLLTDMSRPRPLLHYVCVAMVMLVRDSLLNSDFAECLRVLQHYAPFPVEEVLQLAGRLRTADLVPAGISGADVAAWRMPGLGARLRAGGSGDGITASPAWLRGVVRWLELPERNR